MSSYPICLLNKVIFPLFGDAYKSMPAYLPFSDFDELLYEERTSGTQEDLQNAIEVYLLSKNTTWGISAYPEKRASLDGYSRIRGEEFQRPYHIGLDIAAPAGTMLYAPLNGEVVVSEYESGSGNYGGLLGLKHIVDGCVFYSIYGHMNADTLLPIGTNVAAGDAIGALGTMEQNGGWWHHVHLQVLTERGFNDGWVHRALATKEEIERLNDLCPNPLFLLRF